MDVGAPVVTSEYVGGDPDCDHRFGAPVKFGNGVWRRCVKCGELMGIVNTALSPPTKPAGLSAPTSRNSAETNYEPKQPKSA